MKTAVVYVSTHHGNTKKLLDAIAAGHDVTLLDGAEAGGLDLTPYDRVGLAAGIAYGSFYPKLLKLMEECLPAGKPVFFLYTCGTDRKTYLRSAAKIAEEKGCPVLGAYGCLGYDTFGPFKLVGGIAKGHPDAADLAGAVEFYESITPGPAGAGESKPSTAETEDRKNAE